MNQNAGVPYYDGLNQKLFEAIPEGAVSVIEFGCANGRLGEACKRFNPSLRWTGVDVSERAVAEAANRLDEVIQMNLDFPCAEQIGNQYDLVVFGDVLEHLRDPSSLLRLAHAVSTPDARLICCLPNMAHASVIERMLGGDLSYDSAGLLDETHLRFLSPASSFKLLLDAGWLPNLRDTYTEGHLNQPFLQHLLAAAQQLGIPASTAARNIFSYQLIVDCIKTPVADEESSTATFSVIVPVNNGSQFNLNVARSPGIAEVGAEIIPIEGAKNAAEALVAGRNRASSRWIIYCHQDVYFPSGSGRSLAAMFGSIHDSAASTELVGFAGVGQDIDGKPVPSGLVIDRVTRLDFPGSAHALSIDEFAIGLSRDTVHEIDPSFGWHLWATDLCLAALHRRRTGRGRIVRIPLFHNSYNDGNLPIEFRAAATILAKKYSEVGPITTLCGTIAQASTNTQND